MGSDDCCNKFSVSICSPDVPRELEFSIVKTLNTGSVRSLDTNLVMKTLLFWALGNHLPYLSKNLFQLQFWALKIYQITVVQRCN